MNALERVIDRVDPRVSIRLRLLKKRLGRDLLLSVLDRLVHAGDVVVDIGANRGVYTQAMARRVGKGGRVVAVEPFPANVAALRKAFNRRGNVQVVDAALSDHHGPAELHVPRYDGRALDALASLRLPDAPHDRVEIRLRTLDEVLGDAAPRVAFVKCDVEGHEGAVLAGAARTLQVAQPPAIIEIEQRHQPHPIDEHFEWLASFGYVGYFLQGGRLRPLAEFEVNRHQLAFLQGGFVPYGMPTEYVSDFLFVPDGFDLGRLPM